MRGLGCAVGIQGLSCCHCLLTRAVCRWGVVQQQPTSDLAFSPCSCLAVRRAAFRSVKRRGNTSFSSCFLALFSCCFSTRNLRDLCKARLPVWFSRLTPLPTASCVPCPPQRRGVWSGWWDGCHTQPPPQSWAPASLGALRRVSSHSRSGSRWAALLTAVSCACTHTALHTRTSVQGKSKQIEFLFGY